jgi:toxin ParE1/3/4
MTIIWAPTALRDLRAIRRYIAKDDPYAADRVVALIAEKVKALRDFPEMGRMGRLDGTRELIIPDTPYFVAYCRREGGIRILAVIHGARRWP